MNNAPIRRVILRRSFKKTKVFLSLFLLLFLTLFLTAGSFLSVNDSPKQVDAIIVLSGGTGRVEKAAQLYREGYASYMILSNATEAAGAAGDMLQTALALGVPRNSLITENMARSTLQNAEWTLPIMKKYGFASAMVVSSDFHMRRVKFLFNRVYRKSGIELRYLGSETGYKARRWWSDRYSRETTFNEYVKMAGNAFGYNGPEAKNTLEQIKNWFR